MTPLLFARSAGKVGIVSTLSATSPVIILPMIGLRTGQRPAADAWFGAALVFACRGWQVAEREGFEPSEDLRLRLISSQVHSTTLPPLRELPACGQAAHYSQLLRGG